MDGERFRPTSVRNHAEWVELLCVGGELDGRRISVPADHPAFWIPVNAEQTAEYRVVTVSMPDGDYALLKPAAWSDAQAMTHLLGPPKPSPSEMPIA